ncbi:MAG: SRPBCC domain-containing protein, partial [Deltaproteobacteria bacterium]|nr:SRPBCC domain-containing protein [Deltaproteobacteria bacterium]
TMPVCEIDFRVGGKWRYVMVGTDGNEVAFNGEYREIVPAQRIVQTEIFEPFPDSPSLCTMTLEERDGKTYYQTLVQHTSKEARDMHVQSGMEVGAGIALDRLEEIAQSLATPRGSEPESPRATR